MNCMKTEETFAELCQALPKIAALAVEKRVEVTVTISPDNMEIRTSPWAPLQYICPAKAEVQP